jgi:predicted transcriptional regulator
MEVRFTAEQEAELADIAAQAGKAPSQIVQETLTRVLSDRARFLAGVQRGREASAQGEFVEHDQVVERIERIFRS